MREATAVGRTGRGVVNANGKDGAGERDGGFSGRGDERGTRNRKTEHHDKMLHDESCP